MKLDLVLVFQNKIIYAGKIRPLRFLVDCIFLTSHSETLDSCGHVKIIGDRLQDVGLMVFEEGMIFLMHHLLRYGAVLFEISSEEPLI